MRPSHFAVAAGFSFSLALGAPSLGLAAEAPAPAAPATPAEEAVEPEARNALQRMSAYLMTLNAFEVTTQTSLDLVTEGGQRVQLDGSANYKVKRPDSFVINVSTDLKKRTFFYDGKQITIFSPELGFYATNPAPPTILQTLDVLWEKFGIALPLEDLFRWNDEKSRRAEALDSGFYVGPATIDGAATEHYAFRQGEVDWQVWIEKGERPLPRKLVIIDRSEPAQPSYSARLAWRLDPQFAAGDFTFRPDKQAKAIRLTALGDRRTK